MLKHSFGDRLRFLRQVKMITQEGLADAIGVTKQHLGCIERGLSSPSFEALERLCGVLEVPPASLFLFGDADAAFTETATFSPRSETIPAPLIHGSGSWSIDVQTGEERWSNALHRLLGYSRQQPPSRELFKSHIHELDRESFDDFYEKVLSGVTPRPISCRILRNVGSFRHVRIHVDSHSDKDGTPITISMHFLDATELRELSQTMLLNQEQLEQAIHEKTRSLTNLIEQNELEIQRRGEAERRARVFQDMVEASIDPMSFVSADYMYLAANNKAAEIWGTTPEAMQGRKVAEIIDAEIFEQTIKPLLDAALTGEGTRSQGWVTHADGSQRFLDVTYTPRRENGSVVGVVTSARDMTALRQVEEALGQSEELLRTVTNNMPGTVYQCRMQPDGTIDFPYVSEGVRDMFGISPEEATSDVNAVMALVHEEDQETVQRIILTSATSMTPYSLVHRLRRPDGVIKWIKAVSTPYRHEDNSIVWQGVALDITEQKTIEARLEQNNITLETAERLAGLGSWKWDMTDKVLPVSKNWLAIHGSSNPTPTIDDLLPIAHPEDVPVIEQAFARAEESGEPYSLEHRIIRQDSGEVRWVRAYGEVQQSRDGQPRIMFGASLDITESKQREAQLLVTTYALESSLSGVAFADLQGNITYANPRFKEMHGYALEEQLTGLRPGDLLENRDDERVILKSLEEHGFFNDDIRIRRRDGAIRIHKFESHLVSAPFGEPLCLMGSFEDVTEQRLMLRQLRESEQRFASLCNNLDGIVFRGDPQFRPIYMKGAVEEITGYVEEDFLLNGVTWDQLIHPEDLPELLNDPDNVNLLGDSGHSTRREYRILRQDGEERWVSETIHNVPDDAGAPAFLEGVTLDITREKRAAEALCKSEALYRAIFEKSSEGLLLHDCQGAILDANQTAQQMFGYSLEELRQLHASRLVHPDELEAVRQEFEAIVRDEFVESEHRYLRKDGSEMIFVSRGKLVGENLILGVVRDITEKREAEERLRRSLSEFETIFSNSSGGIAVIDEQRRYQRVNERFCTMFGYSESELLGQSTRKLHLSEEHFLKFDTIIKAQSLHSDRISVEYPLRHKAGHTVMCLASARRFSTESPENGFIWVLEDITDKIELERLREDVERVMRHDLKTPLNGILGVPQLLLTDDNLTEEQRELVHVMESAGRRMLHMIDHSLDLFKMETGAYEYTPREVDVVNIVREIIKDVEAAEGYAAKDVTVLLTRNGASLESSFWIQGEESLLFTMLSNFILNAVQASPKNERVVVDLCDKPSTSIRIFNRGAVPAQIRNDFFKKYRTHGKSRGTGLGTYSSKLIADTMGYGMRLDTSDEENTTSITIFTPALQ
jgi:PAS domain S-box-containing protein